MPIRSRLAPTPSGYLHYGNLLNFVLSWVEVRRRAGTLLLRIDDLDATRSREIFVDELFATLQELGFDWDEGPRNALEFRTLFSQNLFKDDYREFLGRLPGYACDCSRQQLQARNVSGYDGRCRERRLQLLPNTTQWRLRADAPAHDIVLWRKEDLPAYHLVSLHEDLRHSIDLIIRGEDLRESTAHQRRMAELLGEDGLPFLRAEFRFHPLLLDTETGKKLSKSEKSHSIREDLERGKSPDEIFLELSRLAGRPKVRSLREALETW